MVRLIKTETVISVLMGHFIKKLLFILLFVGGTDCSGKRTKRKEYVFVQENWQQVYCQH